MKGKVINIIKSFFINASNIKDMMFSGVGGKDEPATRKNNNKIVNNPEKIKQAKQELKNKRENSKQSRHTKSMSM